MASGPKSMTSRIDKARQKLVCTRESNFRKVGFERRTHLTERTRRIQSQFDKVSTTVWRHCQDELVKKGLLPCIPPKILQRLKKTPSVDDIFLWISVYIKWFQYDLLKEIVDQLGDVTCTELLSGYEAKLKCYFEQRVRPLKEMESSAVKFIADNNDQHDNNSETFVVEVDDAWNEELLLGENCTDTCKQIGSILGKTGKICGDFHDPYLYIHVLHSSDM